MASRKEYEMMFMLNASLNGNFKGAFSNAQAEFAKLGREIQELHKLQANVSSYQKQEQAIASTTQKLTNLHQQEALLVEQIKATRNAENQDAAAVAALEREKLKLEQRIKDTETALDRQKQKLEATGQKLQEAGVNTANLAQADAQLTAQIKELQAQQDKATDSASHFGEQAAQGFGVIQNAIITAGIADKINEIKDAYVECVTIAADFQESMSNVEALSGSTAREMAELTAEAKELGATTKFTAQESADAMGYMAMAGWDAQEMISGMAGVISLAAAAGEDLAQVSDIVTDNLTAFGLTAADTAHFSDVLAAAAANSNTSVGIMGETFKQSAAVAGALGYSIEDVAVGVGLMANAGVKGSIAGTALKNTFNGLLEGATLTAAAFGEYEFTAVKADGTMKEFSDTINELRVYFEQMTEAERVNNAMALAGRRGYNGLLAILNATDADYQSLTNSINNCTGAAQRMADTKLDNLNGQLTLMNSAWEAVQTTIGEQFNPELRRAAEIGTEVLSGVNSFIQENPALVKGLTAAGTAVGAGVVALTGVAAVTKVLIPLMGALTAATPGVNIIVGVTAAVAGIAAAVAGLTTALDNGVPSVEELTSAAADMRETMESAAATYDETTSSVLAAANVADTYIGKLEEMGDYERLSAEGKRDYHNTLVLLTQVVPELADCIDLENNAIEGGTAALRENTEAWKQNAMAQAYQDQLSAMYASQAQVLIEAEENSISLTRAQYELDAATQKYSDTAERMKVLYTEAEAAAASYNEEHTFGKNAVAFLTDEYYELERSLSDIGREMVVAQDSVDAYTQAVMEGNDAAAAAQEKIDLTEEAVRNLTGATEDQTAVSAEAIQMSEDLQAVIAPIRTELEQLAVAYNEAYEAASESISGQYDLWDEAAKVTATSASSINSAIESQISYWEQYNSNLQSLGERSADIEGLSDMIATFADGSTDSVNAIAGMSKASDKELQEMVSNWQELQEQQSQTSESLAQLVTDFPGQIEELVAAMEEGVEGMSMPDEAQESARSTIQAFIDEASVMSGPVSAAYARLGKIASDSLGVNMTASSTSRRTSSGYVPDTIKTGFASGTNSAPPGWAWVGEEGPELMRMRGGETVLPAEVSQEFAFLTAYKQEVASYANGTGDASAAVSEYLSNTAFAPIIDIPPDELQAAAESVQMMEVYNTAYNTYRNDISNPADIRMDRLSAVDVMMAPESGSGPSSPINVEIHIHLDGSATPETVQALEDYVRRGEIQEEFEKAWERVQTDARRRDWF